MRKKVLTCAVTAALSLSALSACGTGGNEMNDPEGVNYNPVRYDNNQNTPLLPNGENNLNNFDRDRGLDIYDNNYDRNRDFDLYDNDFNGNRDFRDFNFDRDREMTPMGDRDLDILERNNDDLDLDLDVRDRNGNGNGVGDRGINMDTENNRNGMLGR